MATSDQTHWDNKYRQTQSATAAPGLPARFEPFSEIFAAAGTALEIACGTGAVSVWLAQQGVQVTAVDISPVAVAAAQGLAEHHGVVERCHVQIADLDNGLPDVKPVGLIVCNMFRDAALDQAMLARLRPSGILAIAALSEVGAQPGRFRVSAGELTSAFADLDVLAAEEADGVAWLVASKSL